MFSKLVYVIIVSCFASVAISLVINQIPLTLIHSTTWPASVLFHLLFSFLLKLILRKKTSDPQDAINRIMLISMGRLLFCMIGVFVYSLVDKPGFTAFAIHFLVHYAIFTVLEILYLLKFIKTQNHE